MSIIKHLEDIDLSNNPNHVRNTDRGIFINENSLEYIASRLTRHLRGNTPGKIITKREAKEEIKKRDKFYLFDKGNCLVGYIAEDLNAQNISTTQGNLVSCGDRILIDDPIFKNQDQIQLTNEPNLCAYFHIGRDIYAVEDHAFHRFSERIGESEAMKKQLKDSFPRDLRDKLKTLYKMFKSSVIVDRPNSVSQTIKYNFKDTEYRTTWGWIFVVEQKRLKTCYEVGKISDKGYKLK